MNTYLFDSLRARGNKRVLSTSMASVSVLCDGIAESSSQSSLRGRNGKGVRVGGGKY
jgi:hypothetical protein